MFKCFELGVALESMSHQLPLHVALEGSNALTTLLDVLMRALTYSVSYAIASHQGDYSQPAIFQFAGCGRTLTATFTHRLATMPRNGYRLWVQITVKMYW